MDDRPAMHSHPEEQETPSKELDENRPDDRSEQNESVVVTTPVVYPHSSEPCEHYLPHLVNSVEHFADNLPDCVNCALLQAGLGRKANQGELETKKRQIEELEAALAASNREREQLEEYDGLIWNTIQQNIIPKWIEVLQEQVKRKALNKDLPPSEQLENAFEEDRRRRRTLRKQKLEATEPEQSRVEQNSDEREPAEQNENNENEPDRPLGRVPLQGEAGSSKVTWPANNSEGEWNRQMPCLHPYHDERTVEYDEQHHFGLRFMVLRCGWRPGQPLGALETYDARTCFEPAALDARLYGSRNVRMNGDRRGLIGDTEHFGFSSSEPGDEDYDEWADGLNSSAEEMQEHMLAEAQLEHDRDQGATNSTEPAVRDLAVQHGREQQAQPSPTRSSARDMRRVLPHRPVTENERMVAEWNKENKSRSMRDFLARFNHQ
ncbi:hypothetical protein Slin15195_G064220 [Septoria linicola]|uniref:Uncharacterized protein n=1 Tax=Septoria linicola TaxID=215465 RepID=A0A9Q9EL62_9PEZI|nr:hypothetical protein Slin15195_G064220 [Septoria linicola]